MFRAAMLLALSLGAGRALHRAGPLCARQPWRGAGLAGFPRGPPVGGGTPTRLCSGPGGTRKVRVPGPGEGGGIEENFVRSSGPGGQNVNKLSTKVELRLRLEEARWLPQDVKSRLLAQQKGRVNKDGELIISSQEFRTQGRNRQAAFDKLQEFVDQACIVPKERKLRKGLTRKAKERRLQNKKKRSETKQNRRRVDY